MRFFPDTYLPLNQEALQELKDPSINPLGSACVMVTVLNLQQLSFPCEYSNQVSGVGNVDQLVFSSVDEKCRHSAVGSGQHGVQLFNIEVHAFFDLFSELPISKVSYGGRQDFVILDNVDQNLLQVGEW